MSPECEKIFRWKYFVLAATNSYIIFFERIAISRQGHIWCCETIYLRNITFLNVVIRTKSLLKHNNSLIEISINERLVCGAGVVIHSRITNVAIQERVLRQTAYYSCFSSMIDATASVVACSVL